MTGPLEDTATPGNPFQCRSGRDGDCIWEECPQLRDNEPHATGRSCPLEPWHLDEEGLPWRTPAGRALPDDACNTCGHKHLDGDRCAELILDNPTRAIVCACTTPAPSADLPDDLASTALQDDAPWDDSDTRALLDAQSLGKTAPLPDDPIVDSLHDAEDEQANAAVAAMRLPDDLAEARQTFIRKYLVGFDIDGEEEEVDPDIEDDLDALIALAQADDEAPASVHWRALAAEENARARLAEGKVAKLRGALEDALMGLAIFGVDNSAHEVEQAIERGRRALATPKPVEPEDGS